MFTEWCDEGTVEAVHSDHGKHQQHTGVVLPEPELVGGLLPHCLVVGWG